MRKDKKSRNEYARDYMKKKRKGLTSGEKGLTLRTTIPYHIVEKLANPDWRERLERMKIAFEESHHPDYASDLMFAFCGTKLSDTFDWLEVTG